jgi:hypothetical protein
MNLEEVGYMSYDLVANQVSDIVVLGVSIPANGSGRLVSGTSLSIKIKARETGSSDPWVDLSVGIDLSSYPVSTEVDFDFRAEAQSVDTLVRGVIGISVIEDIFSANWLE